MKIEGTFNVAAARPEVWQYITDPGVMGSCIPGCDSIEVTGDRFESILEDWGCSEIPVQVGEEFDPAKHEAVEAEPGEVAESEEEHRIVVLRRRGWMLHDIVLQVPQVVVS